MRLMIFLHFAGMSLWLGGMVAAMVLAVGARDPENAVRRAAQRFLGKVYSAVVAPGALLTVLTGLALTMQVAQRSGAEVMARPGMWVMQVAGLVAGLLVLFVGLPAANNLARLVEAAEDGAVSPSVPRLQRRLSIVAHIVATLVVLSLFFVAVVR